MNHDTRPERLITAAAERATGMFWCTSSAHMAKGKPVIVRGRKVCAACASERIKRLRSSEVRKS